MNKLNLQEMVEKAIKELNGKLMSADDEFVLIDNGMQVFISLKEMPKLGSYTYICSTEEFLDRARELGWVSGYKWGVEYPTNGKKPDLPDYVYCQIRENGVWLKEYFATVGEWEWHEGVAHFRIVDERYEPKSKSEPEIPKECPNDFPFIGCLAEHTSWWVPIKIKFLGERLFIAEKTDASTGKDREVCGFIGDLRPIKSEREKFVDAALACLTEFKSANQVFAEMYDAGFRAPDLPPSHHT